MRHLIAARRAGVLTGAAAAGVLLIAGPAAADVTVDPPTAAQGAGENEYFSIPNTSTSAITEIRLVLPPDSPIAEVYPLSTDNWAPRIIMRNLDTPLPTLHGGAPATQATSEITWIAMPGKALAPGKTAKLGIAIGPLPTLSEVRFTLHPKYADGRAAPPFPPVTLKLTPAPAGQAPTHGHSGTGTGTGQTDGGTVTDPQEAELYRQLVAENEGPGFWGIAGWVIAGLGLAGVAAALLRRRRRGTAEASDETTAGNKADEVKAGDESPADSKEPKEKVGAGTKVTSWSYRDGPDE